MAICVFLVELTVCLFFVLWAYIAELCLVSKATLEHYSAIWTRSSVVERYLQDGLNEPKKPPIAYWKACVQKILIFQVAVNVLKTKIFSTLLI